MGFVAVWAVLGAVGAAIAVWRTGHAGLGAAISVLLGPLGWLLAFCLPDVRARCANCRAVIDPQAFVCQHCGKRLRSDTSIMANVQHESTEAAFCMKCGVDGVSTAELGRMVYYCTRCGRKL